MIFDVFIEGGRGGRGAQVRAPALTGLRAPDEASAKRLAAEILSVAESQLSLRDVTPE